MENNKIKNKIKLIIPSDDIHREIFKLKADKGLKSANEVLKLLLEVYNKFKIKQHIKKEIEQDEKHIKNSNIKPTKEIADIY